MDFLKSIAQQAGNEYASLVADGVEAGDVDSFIDDITKASYESEMDLDRDTPEWLGHS